MTAWGLGTPGLSAHLNFRMNANAGDDPFPITTPAFQFWEGYLSYQHDWFAVVAGSPDFHVTPRVSPASMAGGRRCATRSSDSRPPVTWDSGWPGQVPSASTTRSPPRSATSFRASAASSPVCWSGFAGGPVEARARVAAPGGPLDRLPHVGFSLRQCRDPCCRAWRPQEASTMTSPRDGSGARMPELRYTAPRRLGDGGIQAIYPEVRPAGASGRPFPRSRTASRLLANCSPLAWLKLRGRSSGMPTEYRRRDSPGQRRSTATVWAVGATVTPCRAGPSMRAGCTTRISAPPRPAGMYPSAEPQGRDDPAPLRRHSQRRCLSVRRELVTWVGTRRQPAHDATGAGSGPPSSTSTRTGAARRGRVRLGPDPYQRLWSPTCSVPAAPTGSVMPDAGSDAELRWGYRQSHAPALDSPPSSDRSLLAAAVPRHSFQPHAEHATLFVRCETCHAGAARPHKPLWPTPCQNAPVP